MAQLVRGLDTLRDLEHSFLHHDPTRQLQVLRDFYICLDFSEDGEQDYRTTLKLNEWHMQEGLIKLFNHVLGLLKRFKPDMKEQHRPTPQRTRSCAPASGLLVEGSHSSACWQMEQQTCLWRGCMRILLLIQHYILDVHQHYLDRAIPALNLNDTSLTDKGVTAVALAIAESAPHLEELEMALNEITPQGTTPSGSSPPVSIEEQLLLLGFFESKIGAICAELRLPRKVKATALIYFKRFFVHRCCLDNEPSRVMLTCIYLAAKIEESYISAEEFCRAARQDASVVLKGEVGVLQALHFDLVVHSPYRALVGFIKSIEEGKAASSTTGSDTSKGNSSSCSTNIDDALLAAPPETIQHCRQSALHALDTLMLTDAPLLFTPSQMALAALRSGCSSKGIKLHKFLRHVAHGAAARAHTQQQQQVQLQQQVDKEVPEEKVAKAVSQLMGVISQVDQLGMQRAAKQVDQQTEKQQVADVDRRIKLWRSKDPMSNAQSEEYKQAQQAGERDKAAKREAKLRARQESRAQQEAQLLGVPSSALPPK